MSNRIDDDQTIRYARTPPPRKRPRFVLPAVATAAIGVSLAGIVGWIALYPAARPPVITEQPAAFEPPLSDEATILAARASDLLVFRFRDAPAVVVLSFPSLAQQGQMLDRVAAFVEKGGLPRDRVLSDTELDTAIRQSGDTPDTYYYGHDYRAADLAHFFAAAERNGVSLNAQERRLRGLIAQAGMLASGANGAIITLPPEVASESIDATSRATILRHELSHGAYFTDPVYAAYVQQFWETGLTSAQRAGFRAFLGSEKYDTADEDLMLNEAHAFLIYTPDARYFQPKRVGLSDAEAQSLRQNFIRGMKDGWLKASAQKAASSLQTVNGRIE
jgi:hypothetical protein